MSRLSPRRFRDTITRLRTAPGAYVRGQYEPGPVTETALPASVQALDVEDHDFVGGARLEERLKVFVPRRDALLAAFDICLPDVAAAEHADTADTLRWGGDVIRWGADELRWGGGLAATRGAALDDLVARGLLSAAAADEYRAGGAREDETQVAFVADQVRHDLADYTVEESRLWSGHTRAMLVRSS